MRNVIIALSKDPHTSGSGLILFVLGLLLIAVDIGVINEEYQQKIEKAAPGISILVAAYGLFQGKDRKDA